MKNIEPLVSSVEKAVAAHRAILADAESKANAERDALAERHAGAAAELAPIVQAAADLANTLGALTSKRAEAIEYLRIARHQLGQQLLLVGEFDRLVVGNVGNFMVEKNPGVFVSLLENRAAGFLATAIAPRIQEQIAAKEQELEETENQIAELAKTAKAPAK